MASIVAAAVAIALAWGVDASVDQLSMQTRISSGECWGSNLGKGQTFFPSILQARADVSLAQLFDIKYSNSFKVVISKMAKEQYVLTQCGQAQPTDSEVNAVAPLGVNYSRKYFTVPLQSVSALSTVQLSFLEALNVEDRVLFVSKYATSTCWQKGVACGAVLEDPGNYGYNVTKFQLQRTSVDAVFMDCTPTSCSNVNAVPNGVHVPTTYDLDMLAIAEYIKYLGAFFNKEPLANDLFSAAKTSYAQASAGGHGNLVVAWINFNKYGGKNWDQPEFVVSQATYKMRLTSDAGASNLNASSALADLWGLVVSDAVPTNPAAGKTYSVPVSAYDNKSQASERFFAALAGVDVVVDEVYAQDPRQYNYTSFLTQYGLTEDSSLRFMRNKMVLRIDRTMAESNRGLDWYESRVAHPDYAVEGLARVLFGDASKRQKYFRNVAKGEGVDQILSASACTKTLPACTMGAVPVVIKTSGPSSDVASLACCGCGLPSLFGSLLVPVIAIAVA